LEIPRFDINFTMFGIIRSARSRLHRDSGCFEDAVIAAPGVKKPANSTSTTGAGTIRGRSSALIRSRSSLGQRAGSENAAPENKQQAPMANSTVLGDATNTYCGTGSVFGDKHAGVTESLCMQKPNTMEQRFTQVNIRNPVDHCPFLPSDSAMDVTTALAENAQNVADYAHDIFEVLKRDELVNAPSPNYMDKQQHVNAKMRGILLDWLVDVHRKYKCQPETLFLAVHLIDRYLELHLVARRNLQLVGITALLIAAKFEEVYPPQMKDLVYVTDKAYTQDDILQMEVSMLKALQFKICHPTAMHFLERYQSVNGCTDAHRDLAHYLLELTLVDYSMLKHTPSHLAAASILLSNKLLRRPAWTPAAVRQTQMTEAMLKSCAKEICDLLECAENSPLQAVRKKYSQAKHHSVAKLDFAAGADATPVSGTARRSSGGIMMDIA